LSDLYNFDKYLRNPLETALNEMKNNIPSTSKECNDILNILLQQQKKNGEENLNSKTSPILNGDPNRQPSQGTTPSTQPTSPQIVPTPQIAPSPQTTPKTKNKLIASSPRNIVPKTIPANSIAGANPNVQQTNSNKVPPKLKTKPTPNQEDKKNEEILLELSEETYEDDDSKEQSDENIQQNSPVKLHTPNDKAGDNPVPIKNEKLDDDSSYESGSGSYESSEEDNANKVFNAVPTSNK